jgi:hypothetical protein
VSPSNNLGKVTTRCRVGGLSIASHVMGSQALGMERRIEYTRAVTDRHYSTAAADNRQASQVLRRVEGGYHCYYCRREPCSSSNANRRRQEHVVHVASVGRAGGHYCCCCPNQYKAAGRIPTRSKRSLALGFLPF